MYPPFDIPPVLKYTALKSSTHLLLLNRNRDRGKFGVSLSAKKPTLSRNCEGLRSSQETRGNNQRGTLRGQEPVMLQTVKLIALALTDKGFFSTAHLKWIIALCGILFLGAVRVQAGPLASSYPQRQTALTAALQYLHQQQQADGAVGGVGNSCETAWVVTLAGEDAKGPAWTPQNDSLWDACVRDVPTYLALRDPGRIAKVLRAAVAVGADARHVAGIDLIDVLEQQYDPDTGLYHPFSLYRHNLAVLALSEAGRPLPPEIIPTLINQQLADGSWGWPVDPTPGDGDPATGDPDTTGLTLQVLATAGVSPEHPAMVRGVAYILRHQHDDAGWGNDELSDSNATAWIIIGLIHAGWDPTSARFQKQSDNPLTRLLSFQDADGAFRWRQNIAGSLMRSTLDAIPALSSDFLSDQPTPLRSYFPMMLSMAS